ncbi:membrane protein DedA with SNARE-associated domain [Actinocrispum wychmicini]|uniref:Membrane protein DedA with SNARE-associated domain n=2 Tax=Actinocrispum wychmicini TaxID=1213861 RepID=A0A4R2K6C5_9PSEU|nr:membrane protein DedA with SNARE-associated domain [Actinocrispum wychmicini]
MPNLHALAPVLVLVTIFVLSFLETTLVIGVILPGEVLVGACIGVLHVSWAPIAGVAAAVGCLAGQLAGYGLGRWMGPAIKHGWVGRKAGPKRWAQAERLVGDTGGWLLVTARFVSVAHTLAPVLAGALRMPLRRFTLFAAISSVVWAAIWTAVGAALSGVSQFIDSGLLSWVMVLGGVVIGSVVLGKLLKRTTSDDVAEDDDAEPTPREEYAQTMGA